MLDVPQLVEKVYSLEEDESLWVEVGSKGEQEALKMRIWRFLKKFKGEYDLVISMRAQQGKHYVVLRKCTYKCFKVKPDGSREEVDLRLAKLRKQMEADGLSAEEIEAILADKSTKNKVKI